MKSVLLGFFLSVLLLAAMAGALLFDAQRQLHAPLRIEEHRGFELKPGSRLRDALDLMRADALFTTSRQAWYLEIWARATGQAAGIKAGEYSLDPGLSSLDVLALMVGGKTVLHELRVVEGLRFEDALKIVLEHPELQHSLTDTRPQAVMAAIGRPELHPEGRVFPDTYRFPKGTTDNTNQRQAVQAMDKVLAETWAERVADLPYARPEDALIMASIVEKETGLASEREAIAGVFVRRLQMGMRLQTDPTVIYGLGNSFDGNLRKRDLLADGPYNTYARAGLPPTPICLPGRAAVRAAVNPAQGTALFFVSRGDGSHQFSDNLADHDSAVRRYQLGQQP